MSDVAVSNPYVSQAAYTPTITDTEDTQSTSSATGGSNSQSLQSMMDQAVVQQLLQLLAKLSQNHGMPKFLLKEIADFLQNYLANGGAVEQPGGAAHQTDAVHLQPGQTITVGDTQITVDDPGAPSPLAGDDTVHLKPGQSITVGDTEIVAGGVLTTQPISTQPVPAQPVTTQPGTGATDLVSSEPVTTTPNPYANTRPITVQDFANRFALPLLLSDGSTVLAVSPTGSQTFGIAAGTPLSEVDFTKLNAQYAMTAEGQIVPRTRDQVSLMSQPEAIPASAAPTSSSSAVPTSSTKASTVDQRHEDTSKYLETVQSLATQAMENTGDETTKKLAGVGKVGGKALPNAAGAASASGGAVDTASLGFPIAASGKSWLMAIAEAMGKVLGNKVQQMLDSSSKMASLNVTSQAIGDVQKKIESDIKDWKDAHPGFTVEQFNEFKLKEIDSRQALVDNEMKMNGNAFTLEGSKLQGASQEFSMLQNAFSNTLKSIGEGLGQLARKG